jgi:hypothetical protein
MQLGRLISHIGASAEVRLFGAALTRDRRLARSEAATFARRDGSPPADCGDGGGAGRSWEAVAHARPRIRLGRCAANMINDHSKEIADLESQARGGGPRPAKLARMQLPTFREPLRISKSIRD